MAGSVTWVENNEQHSNFSEKSKLFHKSTYFFIALLLYLGYGSEGEELSRTAKCKTANETFHAIATTGRTIRIKEV